MLAQLEVKEINSRTFKDFCWFSRTFQSWNFSFFNSRTFQDFQGPWKPCGLSGVCSLPQSNHLWATSLHPYLYLSIPQKHILYKSLNIQNIRLPWRPKFYSVNSKLFWYDWRGHGQGALDWVPGRHETCLHANVRCVASQSTRYKRCCETEIDKSMAYQNKLWYSLPIISYWSSVTTGGNLN